MTTNEDEERAKRHMLRDRKDAGQVPEDYTKERIDRVSPDFWETGKLAPRLRLVK